jgi:hypothetical protein
MLSTTAPEQWLESFTRENLNKTNIKRLSSKIFSEFQCWCGENNIKYDTTSLKFAVNLKNLKIEGVEKGIPTKIGATKSFNIKKLIKHFNLGCLVEL